MTDPWHWNDKQLKRDQRIAVTAIVLLAIVAYAAGVVTGLLWERL